MDDQSLRDPERVPVIIGAGQVNDREDDPFKAHDSLGLMAAALREAEADGGGDLLKALDSLAIVDQISFRELGPLCEPLAAAVSARPFVNYQSEAPHGDTPIRLLNEAANRIGAGEIKIAAVVGGEALRTAARRAAARAKDGAAPDLFRASPSRREPNFAQRYGLWAPVDVYPLYENAGRAAYGQSLIQGQAESGEIWSRFSETAAGNDGAWIRRSASREEILSPSAANRPIAFPYNKLMVANSSVNQGAGFIVASLAEARRRGVAQDRLVYVGLGAAAKEHGNVLKRDRYDRSVSMDTAIRRTLALNRLTADQIDLVELYSCFPCVPKMARRTLGWPADRPLSVFGGLTFGGGPIANYMSHAVVSMVQRLRTGGRIGFLFANGGFATDNHCIVLSREPLASAAFPQDFDYQHEADAAREPIPVLRESYEGPATVESYTVFFGRDGAATRGVVVALTPEGERTLAAVPASDTDALAYFMSGDSEPVGSLGRIARDASGTQIWGRHAS